MNELDESGDRLAELVLGRETLISRGWGLYKGTYAPISASSITLHPWEQTLIAIWAREWERSSYCGSCALFEEEDEVIKQGAGGEAIGPSDFMSGAPEEGMKSSPFFLFWIDLISMEF